MYPNEFLTILERRLHMEDLKRMLEIIHKENKVILTVLLSMDKDETYNFDNILADVNSVYDKDFYGE